MNEDTGTWNEVLANTEALISDLEQRVGQSRYSELKLWKDHQFFSIGKRIFKGSNRWDLWTPQETYFGDSALEVIQQADMAGYHDIWEWLPEFNDR